MPSMPDPKPRKQMNERRHKEPRYNIISGASTAVPSSVRHPLCVECGKVAEVVDHIKPVRLGGDFWQPFNHQPLCHRCHNSKSGRESRTPVAY